MIVEKAEDASPVRWPTSSWYVVGTLGVSIRLLASVAKVVNRSTNPKIAAMLPAAFPRSGSALYSCAKLSFSFCASAVTSSKTPAIASFWATVSAASTCSAKGADCVIVLVPTVKTVFALLSVSVPRSAGVSCVRSIVSAFASGEPIVKL